MDKSHFTCNIPVKTMEILIGHSFTQKFSSFPYCLYRFLTLLPELSVRE